MNLQIENFNPTVAELTTLANQYRDLTIAGVDDKEGYEIVHKARMELVRTRGNITKTGKALRDEANQFAKAVIEKEKELVALIEPVEKDLAAKQDAIVEAKERARRVVLLPERKAKLLELDEVVADDDLLGMSVDDFSVFYNSRKEAWLTRKEQALREQEAVVEAEARRIENEKFQAEQAKVREAEMEQARKESAERAERETKERMEREAREVKERAEREASEKAEQEAKAEAEAKEAAELAPDQEKLNRYAVELGTIELPTLKSKKAKATLDEATAHLKKAIAVLKG